MTTDDFTEAARAEAPEPCEHHWVSHGQDSALIPWVIRCDLCGAFDIAEMERAARTHLAAQEPTDAEREAVMDALGCQLRSLFNGQTTCDEHGRRASLDDVCWAADAALAAARAVRRDEEKRAACGCDLTGMAPPAVHIVDRHEERQ